MGLLLLFVLVLEESPAPANVVVAIFDVTVEPSAFVVVTSTLVGTTELGLLLLLPPLFCDEGAGELSLVVPPLLLLSLVVPPLLLLLLEAGGLFVDCAGGFDVVVLGSGCCCVVELCAAPPVPATCRFCGMMPADISSALIDAKPKRKANMMLTTVEASASIEVVVVDGCWAWRVCWEVSGEAAPTAIGWWVN